MQFFTKKNKKEKIKTGFYWPYGDGMEMMAEVVGRVTMCLLGTCSKDMMASWNYVDQLDFPDSAILQSIMNVNITVPIHGSSKK